jgi:hypothetical protein
MNNPPEHQGAEFANLPSAYFEISLNINLYFKKWSSVQVSMPKYIFNNDNKKTTTTTITTTAGAAATITTTSDNYHFHPTLSFNLKYNTADKEP